MNGMSFEAALDSRVNQMLDACIKCGKCVDICPSVQPAGIADESPRDVFAGVLDIVRTDDGPTPRADGRPPACSAVSASRRAITASTLAFCWRWRASPCRGT
jgi:Fe-S oxidoreductase